MSTPGSARETTLWALQGAALERRVGRPTLKIVQATRNEISSAFAKAKTSHPSFPMEERFGFAAAVLKPSKFIRLHNAVCPAGDELPPTWTFNYPARPDPYDLTIPNNLGDNVRR